MDGGEAPRYRLAGKGGIGDSPQILARDRSGLGL
jgi:hypothetical protein